MTMDEAVARLRRYIADTAALNILWEEQESSNTELEEFIEDAIDEFNHAYMPITVYDIDDFPSWSILKIGAVLQLLLGKGIWSARNTLTWSDQTGLNLRDTDVWGRYVNYYNLLVNKWRDYVVRYKRALNISACYDNVPSEFEDLGSTS